jgi:membrane peptidoglycan carboxypeptidase
VRKTDGLLKLIGLCVLAGVLVAGVLFPIAGAAGVLSNQASETVDKTSSDLAQVPPPLVTNITDSSGATIATLYDQYRLPVATSQINDAMRWALVSTEDKRFYVHHGVDWQGTLRAAVSNGTGGDTQGASTLTQQYVKNYLINVVYRNDKAGQAQAREQSVSRKLKEARIAIQLETKLSKAQILTGYLNIVEFAGSIYGIGAAAQAYFDTTPEKLTVPQAALLAGLVNNPITFDPWKHPDAATKRRNLVLDRMVDNQKLAAADAAKFKSQPLGVVPDGPKKPSANCTGAAPEAGFFCQYVEEYLQNAGFSLDDLITGGYTIKTTMDGNISRTIRASILKNVPQVPPNAPGISQAFSVVQPGDKSHNVVAMVSNRAFGNDISKGEFNHNLISEPANAFGGGSSFKIFTSAAALENGKVGLNTQMSNPQVATFPIPNATKRDLPYTLNNDNKPNEDPITLARALAISPNTAFVGLELQTGMPQVLDMAYRLGLRNTLQSNAVGTAPSPKNVPTGSQDTKAYSLPQSEYYQSKPSFTLGVSAVSPLEMSNVSATIKSGGVWCPPNPIGSITDRDGKPVSFPTEPCEQVISQSVANTLLAGLSQDTVNGTSAAAAHAAGWTRPDYGKTGTTNANKSVAFVGGVNDYAVTSMVFADGSIRPEGICKTYPIRSSDACTVSGGFGGPIAGPAYFDAFNQILAGQPDQPLPGPDPAFLDIGDHGPIVPFTIGKKSDDATNVLKAAGYNVTTQNLKSKTGVGQVLGQTPQGLVAPGATITLYVSAGGIS